MMVYNEFISEIQYEIIYISLLLLSIIEANSEL